MFRPAFAFLLLATTLARADDAPVVTIDTGQIRGQSLADGVRAFKGIPYAAPPVGELRWKPPQPAKAWEGVRDCLQFGPACPQPDQKIIGTVEGKRDEDCLHLNVWTAGKEGEKRPVMVWIHGGGFTTGAASQTWYDGATLARTGVVLVSINYRLGPLGFLAHPALTAEAKDKSSGNYGLLDQIAALQWVQRNIAVFGGDKECITIFGESAGAAAVTCLMASPLAKGLFHRAIAESGSPGRLRHLTQAAAGRPAAEEGGREIAQKLGATGDADALAILRKATPEKLLEVSNPTVGLFGTGMKFGPVIDGYVLPEDPVALWHAGKINRVPFIAGTNRDEGNLFLTQLPIRRAAGYEMTVRRLFPGDAPAILELFPVKNDDEVKPTLNRLVTIMAFAAPARAMVRDIEHAGGHAWLYQFTREPRLGRANGLGVFHGLEIPFVFGSVRSPDPIDDDLGKTIRAYWTSFAKTGDPNAQGRPEWPAYSAKEDQYLELGDQPAAKAGLWQKECELIDHISRR